MTTYPSPQERERIIARRRQLMDEVIGLLVKGNPARERKKINRLAKKYGVAEVQRMLEVFKNRADIGELENEEAVLYQEYVDLYRRFGGQRPFLDPEAYDDAESELLPLYAKNHLGQALSEAEQKRLDELTDLLLKGSIYWDDITPEDPPASVPEVDFDIYFASEPPTTTVQPGKRETPVSGSPATTIQLGKGSAPACEKDGFPRLKIGGRLECVAEYLDRCIGKQEVVDVIQRGKTTYYVFENGHRLPLLCACCYSPLAIKDLAAERRSVGGRRLEAMSINPRTLDDGHEYSELVLELSKNSLLSKELSVAVAFEVAVRMRHPANCPHKGRSAAKKQISKRKKKRRKRGKRRKK